MLCVAVSTQHTYMHLYMCVCVRIECALVHFLFVLHKYLPTTKITRPPGFAQSHTSEYEGFD